MANSIYIINKGINKPIEFKGLKAQYIWYLGALVLALLVLFAVLYICGINQYLGMIVVFPLGAFGVFWIYGLSNKYGEHGMMKMMAKAYLPKVVKCNSRGIFLMNKSNRN